MPIRRRLKFEERGGVNNEDEFAHRVRRPLVFDAKLSSIFSFIVGLSVCPQDMVTWSIQDQIT